jgi:hypothetical protein
VVIIEHRYNDPIESTNLRHYRIYFTLYEIIFQTANVKGLGEGYVHADVRNCLSHAKHGDGVVLLKCLSDPQR